MRGFLAVSAALSWLVGAMLAFMPAAFYAPTGIVLTPMLATVAQAHAATLVGLGVVNWLARSAESRVLIAVLAGNLVTQTLSLAVVVRTSLLGAGAAVAPGVVIHVVLGSLFAYFLIRARQEAAR